MSTQIRSGATEDVLTVEPTSKGARATLYPSTTTQELAVADAVGYNTNHRALVTAGINDDNLRFNRSDRMGSQCVGLMTPLFNEPYYGSTILPNHWTITNTTMAATQSAAGILFNSGSITTINTGYMLLSLKSFTSFSRAPLHAKMRLRLGHVVNSVMEFGFGSPGTFNGACPVGAYFQVTAGGTLQPVLTYNSIDTTGTGISFDTTKYYTFDIIADDDEVSFFVQDTSTGLIINEQTLRVPLTQARKWNAGGLTLFQRLYNSAIAPASAPQMISTECFAGVLDTVMNKPWGMAACQMGDGIIHNPSTGVQNITWTNSVAPVAATLSNTAAGYATPGGPFSFAAPAGAATDYCLFGWQVPFLKQLVITNIQIETTNQGAAVAGTPTTLLWGLAVNSTAVSLATASYIRTPLGMQSFLVGAAIGTEANKINADFTAAPIVCEGNRYGAVICRVAVGTATASQTFLGTVRVTGFYE